MHHSLLLLLCIASVTVVHFARGQFNPHFTRPEASGILHLVEWLYSDIQRECESVLGSSGFGAVQVSPVTEVRVLSSRSWSERYEPVSYAVSGRSGDEEAFRAMVSGCNGAGVRVFVEVVLNNMAGGVGEILGTAGSVADPQARSYPAVPYSEEHFNAPCAIEDWDDRDQVRNCQVNEQPDLDQGLEEVRSAVVEIMNSLIAMGVAGFYIHGAKYMWPHDLKEIYSQLSDLDISAGFPEGARPFIYQDVLDLGSGAVRSRDYIKLGFVTEYRYAYDLGDVMLKMKPFHRMVHTGTRLGYLPREQSLVFVDTPELQRNPLRNDNVTIVSFKYRRLHKIALVFLLAHRYGLPRITSSYEFQSVESGPPSDAEGNISPVEFDEETGQCVGGWICEHRWRVVSRMMLFRSKVEGQPVVSWVDNGQNQIAFCRGNVGFVAINAEKSIPFRASVYTCMEPGTYCEYLSGGVVDGKCVGAEVLVNENSWADIHIRSNAEEPYLVLLAGEQL